MRVLWAMLLCFLGAAVAPQSAASDEISQKAASIEAAFSLWMDEVGASNGTLAVRYQGRELRRFGKGWPADKQIELASLSKAITALCVQALADEGKLRLSDPAGPFLGLEGGPSLAEVITQTGGLAPDRTQRKMPGWLAKDRLRPKDRWGNAGRHSLLRAEEKGRPQAGKFIYNNENYALLGVVVESVTGQGYEDACRARVLRRAGVAGSRSPITGSFLPWGGWLMSVSDYARLVEAAYGPSGWLAGRDTPRGGVEGSVSGPVSYGLGMLHRRMGDGAEAGENLWHFGGLCFGPVFYRGSFAVRWTNGFTVVVSYDTCPSEAQARALDQTLARAAFGR